MTIDDMCTLSTAERPLRLAEFDDLFATALRGQMRPSPTTLRWRLVPTVEAAVRDLTAHETACCSFFSFVVTADDEAVGVDVTVPATHVDVLDALAARAAAGMRA